MKTDLKPAQKILIAQMKEMIAGDKRLTAEEGETFNSLEAAVKAIDAVDKATLAGVNLEDLEMVDGHLVNKRQSALDLSRVDLSGGSRDRQSPRMKSGGRKYTEMFDVPRLESGGFSSLHDLGHAMRSGDSQRIRQMSIAGNSMGIPADGGFLVPEQFVADSLDQSLESEIVRPRCRVEPMTSPTKNISSFADDDHTGGELYGGVTMRFEQEGGELNYNILKTRRVTLTAHKAAGMFSATNELLTDAPDSAGGMQSRMAGAFGWNVDRICLATGTGAGQPRSILRDPALITVTKEVGQPADTLLYVNLTKMFARMHPACLNRAVWVMNSTAIPQLLVMCVNIGTSGSYIPVMTKTATGYEILGRPVLFSEKASALGELGDCMLIDFTQYALGILRGGMRIDMSQHVRFTTDETVWRLIMRFDGQGLWKTFFTPVNGDTLSWCVTLEAR